MTTEDILKCIGEKRFLPLETIMIRVVFSIVSHGHCKFVNKLIDSIDDHIIADSINLKIIITENADNNIKPYSSKRFQVSNVRNLRKRGFGDNHNAIFEKVDSDYFIVINPDIQFVHQICLASLINNLKQNKIDIATFKVIGPTGVTEDHVRADITLRNLLLRKINFHIDNNKNYWFAGMFMIFKSNSYRKLNGFDTKYFLYVEDCDICTRARELKFKLKLIDDLRVMHLAQRTSRKSMRYAYWHFKSIFRYLTGL